jgi:phenylacetate-coenzyme A ligase PaaK-like adenylate-forming protein
MEAGKNSLQGQFTLQAEKRDVIHIAYGYGLFTAGLGFH